MKSRLKIIFSLFCQFGSLSAAPQNTGCRNWTRVCCRVCTDSQSCQLLGFTSYPPRLSPLFDYFFVLGDSCWDLFSRQCIFGTNTSQRISTQAREQSNQNRRIWVDDLSCLGCLWSYIFGPHFRWLGFKIRTIHISFQKWRSLSCSTHFV